MMGKRKADRNGLESAVRQLLQAQALAQLQIAQAEARMAKADERIAKAEERLVGHEDRFNRIENLLAKILQMLEGLPEAVKAKIGFSPG